MYCFKRFVTMKKGKILFLMLCLFGFVEQSDTSYYLNKIGLHHQSYGAQTFESNFYRQPINVINRDIPHYYYNNNIVADWYKILNIIFNYEHRNKFRTDPGLNPVPDRNCKEQRFVNFENVPIRQYKKHSQFQHIQHFDSNSVNNNDDISTTTEPVALLGKPFMVPTEGLDEMVLNKSSEEASRKQCVQDCQSSSSYNPVCGSNNVTFFNEEKFLCARNCGIDIFVTKQGECK